MSERDDRRLLAAGAGVSPADPGGPDASDTSDDAAAASGDDIDVVQAVVDLVGDLVEDESPAPDPGDD